ncbi:MAG: LD-carboxypeptidase [Thermoanaerobaculia bacterium]|nr:LD-carboxypeptidase [Thermoanaerobaculia bacterium]
MAAILPPPVLPGHRVGVAALSGAVDQAALDRGLSALSVLGFDVVVADNVRTRWGIFAGEESERLEGFHRLAADPSLSAIFFARGGSGLLGLLPYIDWNLLARFPRAYVGYSDLTPFLLQVVDRLGLVAYHGPMVAPDLGRGLSQTEVASLLNALAGRKQTLSAAHEFCSGRADGVLLGGCLSMLVATLGTEWMPDLSDALLFLEDIDEPDYRIDRMLTQLHLSGNLTNIRGMVLGYLGETWDTAMTEDWQCRALERFDGPVVGGFQVGHGVPNYTLPLGLEACLDGERCELIIGGSLNTE